MAAGRCHPPIRFGLTHDHLLQNFTRLCISTFSFCFAPRVVFFSRLAVFSSASHSLQDPALELALAAKAETVGLPTPSGCSIFPSRMDLLVGNIDRTAKRRTPGQRSDSHTILVPGAPLSETCVATELIGRGQQEAEIMWFLIVRPIWQPPDLRGLVDRAAQP